MSEVLEKRGLTLTFKTNRADVFEFAKPRKAAHFYPAWWKQLPKELPRETINYTATMKQCIGFIEHYKHGFMLPMWSDLNVRIDSQRVEWLYADRRSTVDVHVPGQRGSYLPPEKYQHIKLGCPWLFYCDEEIPFLVMSPFWNIAAPESRLVPPGTVEFKHQSSLNINMFLLRQNQSHVYEFKVGEPLLHVIPMTERQIDMRYELVNDEQWKNLEDVAAPVAFTNSYKIKKELKAEE